MRYIKTYEVRRRRQQLYHEGEYVLANDIKGKIISIDEIDEDMNLISYYIEKSNGECEWIGGGVSDTLFIRPLSKQEIADFEIEVAANKYNL